MSGKEKKFTHLGSFFLITTVILLAPGPGLATIPIPDNESDATVIASADYSHAGKRGSEDFSQLLLWLTSSRLEPAVCFFISNDIFIKKSSYIPIVALFQAGIRAPPGSFSVYSYIIYYQTKLYA